jgi:hypothetical protein
MTGNKGRNGRHWAEESAAATTQTKSIYSVGPRSHRGRESLLESNSSKILAKRTRIAQDSNLPICRDSNAKTKNYRDCFGNRHINSTETVPEMAARHNYHKTKCHRRLTRVSQWILTPPGSLALDLTMGQLGREKAEHSECPGE